MANNKTKIVLKDGTTLSVVLNGTTYERTIPIEESVLSPENLSHVKIDGVVHEDMVLIGMYPYEGGTRFAIREMTKEEKENNRLKEQLENALQSVAELTIIVTSIMGQ